MANDIYRELPTIFAFTNIPYEKIDYFKGTYVPIRLLQLQESEKGDKYSIRVDEVRNPIKNVKRLYYGLFCLETDYENYICYGKGNFVNGFIDSRPEIGRKLIVSTMVQDEHYQSYLVLYTVYPVEVIDTYSNEGKYIVRDKAMVYLCERK